jgi:hypothetical protein
MSGRLQLCFGSYERDPHYKREKMVTHVGHILHSQARELFNRSFADSISTFLQVAPECVS